MSIFESGQLFRIVKPQGGGYAQPHEPFYGFSASQFSLCLFELVEDRRCMVQEQFALPGERETPGRTMEQPNAEMRFQIIDRARDRRVAQIFLPGEGRKAALFVDALK